MTGFLTLNELEELILDNYRIQDQIFKKPSSTWNSQQVITKLIRKGNIGDKQTTLFPSNNSTYITKSI